MVFHISKEVLAFDWVVIMAITIWACVYAWISVERENKEREEIKLQETDNEKEVITNE